MKTMPGMCAFSHGVMPGLPVPLAAPPAAPAETGATRLKPALKLPAYHSAFLINTFKHIPKTFMLHSLSLLPLEIYQQWDRSACFIFTLEEDGENSSICFTTTMYVCFCGGGDGEEQGQALNCLFGWEGGSGLRFPSSVNSSPRWCAGRTSPCLAFCLPVPPHATPPPVLCCSLPFPF